MLRFHINTTAVRKFVVVWSVALAVATVSATAWGQNGGGNGGNQGGGGAGGGGNGNGGVGGIRIDSTGLVRQLPMPVQDVRDLQKSLQRAASANLSADLNRASDLRKVSLRALDLEISRRIKAGQPMSAEILSVAGLTRIDIVAITDDGGDVIIAGPAEGFATQPDGRVMGIHSFRPVLCLDDLLVALRTAASGQTYGCSFDPDSGRLVQMQQLMQSQRTALTAAQARQGFQQAANALGNWNVSVFGVPETSHMAVALVEADFALKYLTTGLLNPQVRGFRSHFAMMKPNEDSLRRWWFSPLYEAIQTNEQRTVFQLSGPRVQVSAQDEVVDAAGNRSDAASTAVSLEKYAQQFTKKLPDIAEKVPAIAQLQNMVDLFVTAAIMQQAADSERLLWRPVVLLDQTLLPVAEFPVPRETPSLVQVRMAGSRTVLGLIAGGVTVTPRKILATATVQKDVSSTLVTSGQSSDRQWWWD